MGRLSDLYKKWLQLSRWQKGLFSVLLAGAVFGLIYYFKITPLQQEYKSEVQKVEQLKLTVSRLKVIEKRKKALLEEIKKLNEEIAKVESKLPTGKEDVSQIIKSITDADSGMVIKLIAKEKRQDKQYYVEFPYKVELLGKYPNFVRWCERLSQADRIINFGNITIKAFQRKGKDETSPYTIHVIMDVKAFTLKR